MNATTASNGSTTAAPSTAAAGAHTTGIPAATSTAAAHPTGTRQFDAIWLPLAHKLGTKD
jgi:hypothetical protein